MITENNYHVRRRPTKPAAGMVPWPDVLARAVRTLNDCDMKAGEESVSTSKDGVEAVLSIEVRNYKGAPPNSTVHVGLVCGKPGNHSSAVVGGVVLGGVPCVLKGYGRYRPVRGAASKINWGIVLDRLLTAFCMDIHTYGQAVHEIRNVLINRTRADALVYRLASKGVINPSTLPWFHGLRQQQFETAWELLSALNQAVGARPALSDKPRTTQLESSLLCFEEVKKLCKGAS